MVRSLSSLGRLPFGLGWQPTGLLFLHAEPVAECLCIIPTHDYHRMRIGLRKARSSPCEYRLVIPFLTSPTPASVSLLRVSPIACFRHKDAKLANSDFIFSHVKGLGDHHPMPRSFVVFATLLAKRAAHHELAGGNEHEFHADGIPVERYLLRLFSPKRADFRDPGFGCPTFRNRNRCRLIRLFGESSLFDLLTVGALGGNAGCLQSRIQADPEADMVPSAVRLHPTPHCRAAVLRQALPRTPPDDALSAVGRSGWIGSSLNLVAPVPVRTPLPHVAYHVVQPDGIGLEAAHRRSEDIAVGPFAGCPTREFPLSRQIGDVAPALTAVGITAPRVGCGAAGPAGIFPLGLRREVIALSLLVAEPAAKRHRIVPTHIDDRVAVILRKAR